MPRKGSKQRAKREPSAAKKPRKLTAASRKKAAAAGIEQDAPTRVSLGKIQRTTPLVDLGRIWDQFGPRRPVEFRVSFARPDDLLVCDFIFDNMALAGNAGFHTLVRKDPDRSATLIVELPPQSFGEEAFLDDPTRETVSPLPSAKIRMSGRSRIAFAMPAAEKQLDFTLDAVLDACRKWPMQLDVNAAPDPDFSLLEGLKELGVFTKAWLKTTSVQRAQATEILMSIAGGGGALEKRFTEAARRIAKQSADALSTGSTKETAAVVQRSMQQELDRVAEGFAPLRDPSRRDAALAALSLLTTEAFAATKGNHLKVGRFIDFGFLSVLFTPHQPSPAVTALELPYRIILSPIPEANWWHETKPVVRHGRTELWHTRLTKTTDGVGPDLPTKVRALWSPDYPLTQEEANNAINKPFRMSLDADIRQMMVELMAGFNQTQFVPHAANSRRLHLSAMGALLDVEGNWEKLPEGIGLTQWKHLATLGRDHTVRVTIRGFLCPFGHAAELVIITERKFESLKGTSNRVAVLRQRFFIRVRERIKSYDGTGHEFHGNNFPFTSVEVLLTKETPDLVSPDNPVCSLGNPNGPIYTGAHSVPHRDCFWPLIGPTTDFMFPLAATDLCGERVTFAMPLLFIGKKANDFPTRVKRILDEYDLDSNIPRRTASFGNASICFAPVNPGSEGDPKMPAGDVIFDAAGVKGVPKDRAQFYPEIQESEAGIAAIQRLLQKPDAIVRVTYPEVYKKSGFGGGNTGEVFLKLVEPFRLEFGDAVKSDALGGLATPSMAIQGLSRIMGPVAAQPPATPTPANIESALGQVINNTFNPADFFKGAKILGGVELATILDIAHSLAGGDVPKLLSKQLPDKIEARFDWNTNINKSDPLGLFVPNAGGTTVLQMNGVVSSPIAKPSATTFTATASVVNFKVNLFGFVTVWFDRLEFTAKSGSKPDVAVDLHPGEDAIAFGGPLEFVNELRKIIPSSGFSDPPGISVTPSGIAASYSINVPSVAVGIFALEHVSLGAGFALPFDSKPAEVRFNFSERQRPFSLTVSLLGGGGFFAIGVGTEGVREIEAALEFGAALSINLGVASGSVEIKAGVYFHWQTKSVELAGYIRLHGELSVLGLISASLTFNLQLAYLKENGHSVVWGEATLEVEIEILFLSFSVSVKCRREFGGSDSDPRFIDLIRNEDVWASYCEAFASEGA